MKLGKANWQDPERRDCIVVGRELRLNRYFRPPFRRMTCWQAQNSAQACLTDAFEKLASLIKNVGHDLYKGVKDDSGIAIHRFMHGSSVGNAQPAIILSSKNPTLRRNAARIIRAEEIEVDDCGIDLEFYANAPRRFAATLSNDLGPTLQQGRGPNNRSRVDVSKFDESIFINGTMVTTPTAACTIGGIVTVDDRNFGLTVGHAFEGDATARDDKSGLRQEIHRSGKRIGSLVHKSQIREEFASDWSLCELNATEVTLTNKFVLPNGSRILPSGIFQDDLKTTSVWVNTDSGCIKGSIKADYSLVALPGGKTLQKTWVVVLDRPVAEGDCGAWMIDANTNKLYGQIVAGLEGTEIAYIALLKDVFTDISAQLHVSNVTFSTEENLTETREDPMPPQVDSGKRRKGRQSKEKLAWDRSYILSFDGGGVRGLSTLYMLKRLMLQIKTVERSLNPMVQTSFHPLQDPRSSNTGHRRQSYDTSSSFEDEKNDYQGDQSSHVAGFYPCHYIDYMAGTSTGGLIAIMLSRLRMSVDDAIDEFLQLSDTIFGHSRCLSVRGPIPWPRPKYDSEILEGAVQDILRRHLSEPPDPNLQRRQNRFSSDSDSCRTLVLSHRLGDDSPYLFRSYDHQTVYDRRWVRNPDEASPHRICEVARATSAAPTYFTALKLENRKYVDGGFGCNNPSWEAWNEVKDIRRHSDSGVALLVSIGTGIPPQADYNSKSLANLLFRLHKKGRVAVNDNTRHADELLRTSLKSDLDIDPETPYFRFPNYDMGQVKFDSWKQKSRKKPATKDLIEKITSEYLEQPDVQQRLAEVARILVNNRRLRSRDKTAWERFAIPAR